MVLKEFVEYKSSSVYNQLLIAHTISKIIFMKYLPHVTHKLVLKLVMLRNVTHLIF